MNPANRSRCVEHLHAAATSIERDDVAAAAESIRLALLLVWDPRILHPGDTLLTVTRSSLGQWLEERAT
jgi:hypothetical protein